MYLLGRVQMIAPLPYEEGVKRLMAHGFDGIEFGISDRQFKPRPEFFSPGFAGEMKSVIQRYGVKAYSVSAHMDYTANDENFQTVYNAIRIAKEMDSPLVIINGAVKNDDEPYEVQWAKQIEYTKRLCDYAQTLGIELAMEYEPGFVIDSTALMLKAFKEINSPVLKVNCDVGHVFLCDPDPMQAIEDCKGLIIHAHLENMKAGVHNHLVPYEGDMDLPGYIAKLREVGFDGMAAFDAYQYDYEAVADESVNYFRSIL
ncbi:MAG: hypothetical protein DBY25_01315 [Clostridiales bacterium]|nr:MAG: hypothetical protein DBY25_01315 [Clostridiales bacterium]